ncbi:MAG: mechanosensitive ion channel family protein [Pseudomonadota bacterium]
MKIARLLVFPLILLWLLAAQVSQAQNALLGTITDSPRQTLESLYTLSDRLDQRLESYQDTRSGRDYAAIIVLLDQLAHLFDLSDLPPALRAQAGAETVADTLDLLALRPALDLSQLPDVDAIPETGDYLYRIDGTPLRLQRISEGTRRGEVLFDSHSVSVLNRLGELDQRIDTTDELDGAQWSERLDQITGPLVPLWLTSAETVFGGKRILDTPAWKGAIAFGVLASVILVLILWHRLLIVVRRRGHLTQIWIRLLGPLAVIAASLWLSWYLVLELHLAGRLALIVQTVNVFVLHVACAWIAWIVIRGLFDRAATGLNRREDSIDVNMLRLIGQIVAAIVAAAIFASGAHALGLPVLSILAGFGIGGLAIALAIRPTFENLIGGFILYIDRPIRVGDFCAFGDQSGTVERIGVRSTQVRALDRTLISIPNAQFADMELINWAACDMMQIHTVLGLRYETNMETLRFVLAEIRKMMHAHPRIDNETIRVRFAGFGAHSLDIDLRVYAQTREWNDFYAIREDMLFRVGEIVERSGSAFAFPSQTLYMAPDDGLDEGRVGQAQQSVQAWRDKRKLPFPRFASGELQKVEGTLFYPPRGSPDFLADEEDMAAGTETLSTDTESAPKKPD